MSSHLQPPERTGSGHHLGLTIQLQGEDGTPTTPNTLHRDGGNIDVAPRFSFTSSKSKTAVMMTEDSVVPSAQPTVIYLSGDRDSISTQNSEDSPPLSPDPFPVSTIDAHPGQGPVQRRTLGTGGSPIPADTIVSGGSSPQRGSDSPVSHSVARPPTQPPSPTSNDKNCCIKFLRAICECCCPTQKK